MFRHKLQVINYLLIPLCWLCAVVAYNSIQDYLLILFCATLNLLLLVGNKIRIKSLFYFSLSLLPLIGATFISSYLFANPSQLNAANSGLIHAKLLGHPLISPGLEQSLKLSLRLYSLALISFAFAYHLPKEQLIQYLLQKRVLSVQIGFSLLAVFNAFDYLSQEFARIQLAYQMRYQQRWLSPKLILPLLIAAARYAHNLSISMYNRGLNQQRSYYQRQSGTHLIDYLYWLFNSLLLVAVYFNHQMA